MTEIRGLRDVYPAADGRIAELNSVGASQLAAGLHARLHQGVWTTGAEFYEVLQSPGADPPEPVTRQMRRIVEVIDADIAERKARMRWVR